MLETFLNEKKYLLKIADIYVILVCVLSTIYNYDSRINMK